MLNNISITTLLLLFVIFLLVLLIIFQEIRIKIKIKNIRQDAVKRSNAVKGGQLAEQLAPFLPNFPCNPADAHFLGQPIDYIAFPGL